MQSKTNYLAVGAAAIVYWLLQAGWYTMFGEAWVAAIGFDPAKAKVMEEAASPLPYVTALLANFVIAYVISSVMLHTGPASVGRGLRVAFLLWGGLVATNYATQYSFEQRSFTLFAINGGSALAGMLLSGVIVGAWKKNAPSAG